MQVDITGKMVLSVPMLPNDAEAENVRQYLVALARQVWEEGEGFSGKRPFGNSGWEGEVFRSLKAFGLDDSGDAHNALVQLALDELAKTPVPEEW